MRRHPDSAHHDPFVTARKTLEDLGFHAGEREALALVAALLQNFHYKPSQIHADRVPERWLFRIKALWAAPPGFRDSVLEHLLYEEYKGTVYFQQYSQAIGAARAAFHLAEEHEAAPPPQSEHEPTP
jgi:hypothetical protein